MKIFKSILSLFLIGAVLFSSMGFSVSQHYCLGMLKSESFYFISEACEGEISDFDCETPVENIHYDCCDDELLALPGIAIVKNLSEEKIDFQKFFPDYIPHRLDDIDIENFHASEHWQRFADIHSKIPPTDILVVYQRFLI